MKSERWTWYYPMWITESGSRGDGVPKDTLEEAIECLNKRPQQDKKQWIDKKRTNTKVWVRKEAK